MHRHQAENRLLLFLQIHSSHRTATLQTWWSYRPWCIALDETSQYINPETSEKDTFYYKSFHFNDNTHRILLQWSIYCGLYHRVHSQYFYCSKGSEHLSSQFDIIGSLWVICFILWSYSLQTNSFLTNYQNKSSVMVFSSSSSLSEQLIMFVFQMFLIKHFLRVTTQAGSRTSQASSGFASADRWSDQAWPEVDYKIKLTPSWYQICLSSCTSSSDCTLDGDNWKFKCTNRESLSRKVTDLLCETKKLHYTKCLSVCFFFWVQSCQSPGSKRSHLLPVKCHDLHWQMELVWLL